MATTRTPATTCTTCKCSTAKCGCQDTMLTTPAPCPSPIACPTPEPCSEVLDAQCIVYTDIDIKCGLDIIVASGTNISDALRNIVDYFCGQVGTNNFLTNGFKVTNCLNENITLPENSTIEYVGPLAMCEGYTLTIPLGTTLTII